MFDEYFYPDGDEDDAAEEFDVDAFDFAEAITQITPSRESVKVTRPIMNAGK